MSPGLHPARGLTSLQGVVDGGIGVTAMVYSDDTPMLIKGLAWASKAIYGDRVQICDGVADEAEINAALTAIAAIGGTVLLSEGTFHMAATASVPANCMLRGMGWGTILEYDAGGNCVTIAGDNAKVRDLKIDIVAGAGAGGTRPNCLYASGRTNLELFGLWLIGDETVADDGVPLRQCGIVWDTVIYSSILNCISQDHKRHGISLNDSSDNNTLTANACNGTTQYGLYLDAASGNTVTGNACSGNAVSGIRMTDSSGNTVTGNTCNGNVASGIYLSHSSDANTLTGNTGRGNADHGIRLNASSGNTVTGNTCNGNTQGGIFLQASSDNNTVSGNSCNANDSGDTGTYDGISLSGSTGNLISENTCKGNDRNGILADVNSTQCVIEGNYCDGNGHHGISCAGNDSQINDNRCFDNSQKTAQTYHGIVLVSGTFRCNLVGNHCDSPGDSQEDGIHLTGTNSGCSLVGNWCYNGMGSGIYIGGGSDQQVHANYCQDNDDYGIELNGCTGVHVKDNLLNSNDTAEYLENACTDIATPEIWARLLVDDTLKGYRRVVDWPDGADTTSYCTLQIPMDFQQLVTVVAVVIPEGTGNLRWSANTSYGKICAGEQENAHTDTVATNLDAVTSGELECLDLAGAFDDLDAGDNAGVQVNRDGNHVDDTVDADVKAIGVRLRYV